MVRHEQTADQAAVRYVTELAFRAMPYSSHTEHHIVDALRAAGALSVSLVEERDGHIVGHIAFSPVSISDGTERWFGLGPVSVHPDWQGKGIGQALVREGLAALRGAGAKGCVVLGEPAYYERFGFRQQPGLVLEGVPPAYFMALPFGEDIPSGKVSYDPAFDATGP